MGDSFKQLYEGLWKAISGLFTAITASLDIVQNIFAIGIGIIFIYLIAIRPFVKVLTAKDNRQRISWLSWILVTIILIAGLFPFLLLEEKYGFIGFIIGIAIYYIILKIAFKLARFTDTDSFKG